MRNIIPKFTLLIAIICCLQSCYRLKGISIPPQVDTYFAGGFQNKASNAPVGLEIEFTDQLIQKINGNTKLNFDDVSPDIEFSGYISRYSVTAVAPQQNDDQATTAFNRLTIAVNIDYVDTTNEEESWNQSFSFFEDFESTTELNSVQDDLIENIFNQILEDLFNKTFTNW